MGWYRIIKTVKGHGYYYDQRSWREGGRVRTESRYIGPVDGAVSEVRDPRVPKTRKRDRPAAGKRTATRSGTGWTYDLAALDPGSVCTVDTHIPPRLLPAELRGFAGNVVENTAGNRAVLADLAVAQFGKVRFPTLTMSRRHFKPGRRISDPIEVSYDIATKRYTITDGAHRTTQALVNGEPTIPAIVEVIDSREGYRSVLDGRNDSEGERGLIRQLFDPARASAKWEVAWRRDVEAGKSRWQPDGRIFEVSVAMGVGGTTRPFGSSGGLTGDGAWWSPSLDLLQIPDHTRYRGDGVSTAAELFEHSMWHELAHATATDSRCRREPWRQTADAYAAEELVAELTANLVEWRLGTHRRVGRSAHYLQHYQNEIAGEFRLEAREWAIGEARKAADYLVARYRGGA